jgi:phosphoenolpyruvate-protein kinase (PTS system EI component)
MEFAAVVKVFTASPVITALLDLGEDRKPCRYTNKVDDIASS